MGLKQAGADRASRRVPTVMLTVMLLAAVILATQLKVTPADTRILEWLNLVLGCFLLVLATSDGFRPVAAVYAAFSFCWLGIAPVVQIEVRQAAWNDWGVVSNHGKVNYALALGIGMNLMLIIGYLIGARNAAASRIPSRGRNQPLVSPVALLLLAGALLVLTPVVIHLQGGVGNLFVDRNARAEVLASANLDSSSGSGVGTGLAVLLPGSLALALAHLTLLGWRDWRRDATGKLRTILWFCGLSSLVGLALFNNPLSNTRFIAAVGLGSVLIAIFQPRSRAAGWFMAIVLLFTCLVVYPLGAIIGGRDTDVPGFEAALTGLDFDGFQQVVNTVDHVELHGHGDGTHILSAAMYFIPRSLWNEKAWPATFEVAQTAGYQFQNLSLPFHAELYLDLGLVGMLFAGGLYGVLMGAMDTAWLVRRHGILAQFVPLVALAQLAVLRGPLGSLTPVYLTPLFALAGMIVLSALLSFAKAWEERFFAARHI